MNMNSNATNSKLGRNYILNGLSGPKMSPIMAEQQQHMQQQQQLQQQQQQQQQLSEQTEPHKHHQQQQQQQQLSSGEMIFTSSMKNSENMSKFMPPQISTAAMINNINTHSNTNANININTTSNTNTINCRNNSLGITTSLCNSNMMTGSSVPLHIRPPLLPSHLTNTSNVLSNGTNNGVSVSADSSRTSSPSLHGNNHLPIMLPSKQSNDDTRSVHQLQQHQQQQTQTNTRTIDKSSINSEVKTLSNSMQNLNVNLNVNGPIFKTPQLPQKFQPPPLRQPNNMMQSSQVAPAQSTNSQIHQNNLHCNFKTSALNASHIAQTASTSTVMAPMNNTSQQFNNTTIQSNVQSSQLLSRSGSEFGGVNRAWSSNSSQNLNNATVAPPSTPLVQQQQQKQVQQTQLNNNQQSVQLNHNNQVAFERPPLPPAVSMNPRKPLYPNSSPQLPPIMPPLSQQQQLQPQQQQQHQQYSAAYVQQGISTLPPPPQSGIFNDQANMQPLRYQNQNNQQQQQQQHHISSYTTSGGSQIMQKGFNRLWGQDTIDLMQNRHILSPITLQPPRIVLHNQFHESINCNYNIMRCTLAKVPESSNLLQKTRLPFGILIHPFRDINSLPVIQCPSIVRCRLCRTYINPFVYFVDIKMWKCNLCYRVNELPDDFQFDPATKTYGDVTRRPEVRSSTIEFIAPSEYMLRPPQPAIYLFLFDVSIIAQQCGYLENICNVLVQHIDDMPGDARTQVGFIAYNSQVHFYSMAEAYNQPHEMTLVDIEDPFLPRPDNLLVNLKECKELVKDLLKQLPTRFADTHDPGSALGSALQVAYKLLQVSGGRITVFQTCLPNKGLGSLESREDPNNRSAKDVAHLNPATDFYKRYALECSGYQIAVDLFLLNQQYSDLATISGISKHSGGCIYHFPLYQKTKLQMVDALMNCFKRYLTRKIGFEAVMRIRCTRGLQVHTFHGNFFVRSVDLLSLPNVNPDAGYGMQISYEENLSDVKTVCFQAALLYTNSEGERRIRVHTLCLPVSTSLPEIMYAADSEAIIGLLSKMAVDRSLTSNVADAREAFINATIDIFNSFKIAQNLPIGQTGQLIAPRSLALMPLYILALLKHPAFRVGTSTRLDDRVYAMECLKSLPLDQLMKFVYPEFYKIDTIFYRNSNADINSNTDINNDEEENDISDVPRLQLSAEYLDLRSIYLMDCGTLIMIYVGLNVPVTILENVFGIKSTSELADYVYGLPNVDSTENAALRSFIRKLNDEKPYNPIIQIIRDTSTAKPQFIEKLIDDRNESSLSYYEFLQHIRAQVK